MSKKALAELEKKGAMTLVPELVELVAGEKISGTWWAHPKGNAIYDVANELEAHQDVITAKLIEGKVTFVHRALWPALLRVVTDKTWRKERMKTLDADAKKLLTKVERAGTLDASDKSLAKARKSLEASLLVRVFQRHTEKGNHVAMLESWSAWSANNVNPTKASAKPKQKAAATTKASAKPSTAKTSAGASNPSESDDGEISFEDARALLVAHRISGL